MFQDLKKLFVGLFLLAVALRSPAAFSQQTTPSITLGVKQALEIPLLQDDGTAMSGTGNPAMLGFAGGVHLDVTTQSNTYGAREGQGLYFTAGNSSRGEVGVNFGFASENLQPDPQCSSLNPCARRTTGALGVRAGFLSLGGQIHQFSSIQSRALDGRTSGDFGIAMRPWPWLSLGFAAYEVNRPSLNGLELPVRYTGSIAIRPLLSDRLTLELDGTAVSCGGTPAFGDPTAIRACGISNTDLRTSIELKAFDGIRLLGAVQHTAGDARWTAEMGLAVDLGHLGIRVGGTGAHGYGYLSSNIHLSSESYGKPAFTDRAVELNLTQALTKKTPGLADLFFDREPPDPLLRTLETLRRLRFDRHVRALVLTANGLPTSLAGAEELRSEIEALRAAGKKVVFLMENGGDLEYYVAASADRVYAIPQALLDINGFSATVFFAAAGLDKLGVKAEFFRIGAYKNAPDLFTRSDMSPEQREVETSMLGDMAARYAAAVVESRGAHGVDEGKLRSLLDRGILSPQDAVEAGLLDGLVYQDQLAEEVGKLLGAKVKLSEINTDPPVLRETRWGDRAKVVLVRVEGAIGMEDQPASLFGGKVAGARSLAKRIRKAADDSDVSAIVVRVDSPGGDGSASDVIWRELVRARKEKGKPVVVSMGEYAASGGYYVAAAGDAIWAEPSTITGSIGVFAGHFDASGLLAKLGVLSETVKTSESADIGTPVRPLTDKERTRMQLLVDSFYKEFVSKVSEGRGMSFEKVDAIARGRVWTGAQAKQNGLVDHLGGLQDAISDAKVRAGISLADDIVLDDERDASASGEAGLGTHAMLRAAGLEGLAGLVGAGAVPSITPALTKALQSLDALGAPNTVRARLPFELDIH